MTTTTEPVDMNAPLREEVQQQFRLLCMGRVAAAHRLAELLVPLNLQQMPGHTAVIVGESPGAPAEPPEPPLVLPVIDPGLLREAAGAPDSQAGPSSAGDRELNSEPTITPAKKAASKAKAK